MHPPNYEDIIIFILHLFSGFPLIPHSYLYNPRSTIIAVIVIFPLILFLNFPADLPITSNLQAQIKIRRGCQKVKQMNALWLCCISYLWQGSVVSWKKTRTCSCTITQRTTLYQEACHSITSALKPWSVPIHQYRLITGAFFLLQGYPE